MSANAPAPTELSAVRRRGLKHSLFLIIEAEGRGNRWSRIFNGAMAGLILANVIAAVAATVPAIGARWGAAFFIFDAVSIGIFTVEYALRLWVCTEHHWTEHYGPFEARLRFALRPVMIIDLIVILSFYVSVLVPLDLRVLRLFRLLRLLKLARYSAALGLLWRIVVVERHALLGAFIIMTGIVLTAGTLIHLAEGHVQPDKFGTIPDSLWWAIVTLSTVGYGDFVPITALGKLVGGLTMVFGLGMYALPVGILATGFVAEAHRRDFVLTWNMIARVPYFARLDAAAVAEIMTLLRSEIVPSGTCIIHRGDPADAMLLVAMGDIDVVEEGRTRRLASGDFYGQEALLGEHTHDADLITRSRCDLLFINADDFRALVRRHPHMRERLRQALADLAAG